MLGSVTKIDAAYINQGFNALNYYTFDYRYYKVMIIFFFVLHLK